MKPSLTLVMPVYNEEQNLPAVLNSVLAYCGQNGCGLLVIDDGSQDGSGGILAAAAAQHPYCTVYTHSVNRGYGAALKRGLSLVQTEMAITIDADGQHRLEDVDLLFDAGVKTGADLVIGSRSGKRVPESVIRSAGKAFIRLFARIYLKVTLQDLNSGFKLYRTAIAQRYLPLCPDGMSFSDVLVLEMLQEGHRVIEQPIQVNPRQSGTAKTSAATGIETLLSILNVIIMFHPMRFFMPIAIGMVVLGVLWGVPFVLLNRGISVASMLLILAGVITFYAGLVTEQLSIIIRHQMRAATIVVKGQV